MPLQSAARPLIVASDWSSDRHVHSVTVRAYAYNILPLPPAEQLQAGRAEGLAVHEDVRQRDELPALPGPAVLHLRHLLQHARLPHQAQQGPRRVHDSEHGQ